MEKVFRPNDRQLRRVNTGLSGEKNIIPREDAFDITVASEVMAILCLANDIEDLKVRLGNIIIGYNKKMSLFCKRLKSRRCNGSLIKRCNKA